MKEKLSLLLALSSAAFGADVNGLIVSDRFSIIGNVNEFAEVSNPNGNASAVDLFPIPLVPVQPVLYLAASILEFEGVSASNTAMGFNFESSIYPLAQPKVSFSSGSIKIGHITSTQGDAYGVKAMSKAIFELYHGLLPFIDASVRFGAISGNRNAYGLQSKQEIELRGSGSFNRGEMSFDGGITAGNDLYGISSSTFKLTGTNLAFKSKLEGGNNAYGIQTKQELLIQESKTSFAPLNAKAGDAYGMWIQGISNIQNSTMSDKVTSVVFDSITAGKNAYAIRSQGDVSICNANLHFGSVQGKTNAYGLYNEGTTFALSENFFNHFGGVMRFNSIIGGGESVGIYNASGNNQFKLQKGSIEFGTISGDQQSYGIKSLPNANLTFSRNSDTMSQIYGFSLQFNHILSQGDSYGLYTQAATKIDLPSFSTLNFGLIEGQNAYGIYASNAPVEIFLTDSTLALSLKGANQKAFMQSGSGKIDLTLSGNSRILIDGDGGTLNALNIKKEWGWGGMIYYSSIIDLSGNHSKREKARTLEIAHYSNSDHQYSTNTVFNLFYSRQKSYADKLTISQAGTEDRIRLDLYVLPSDLKPSSQSQKMIVADVDSKITINGIEASGQEGISSSNQGFEAYTTKLYREDVGLRSQYFIKTDDPSTKSLNTLSLQSLFNLLNQYNLHFYNLGQVSKRLGMIRREHDFGGVWGRMSAGRAGGKLAALSAFNIELGADYGLKDYKEGLDFYIGGHFAYTTSYSNTLNDNPSALEVGIYGAVMSELGWYYYAQVKGEYLQNKVSNFGIESFQINQGVLTLSQELGYRLDFGQKGGFYIEPKTIFDLSISLPTSYKQKHLATSMILDTQIQSSVFLNGKLGGDIGYSFINSKKLKTDLYLGLNYDYIVLPTSKVKLQTPNVNTTFNTKNYFLSGFSLVLGTQIQASRHIKLTMDLDWGVNSLVNLIKGSFGFKYNF